MIFGPNCTIPLNKMNAVVTYVYDLLFDLILLFYFISNNRDRDGNTGTCAPRLLYCSTTPSELKYQCLLM